MTGALARRGGLVLLSGLLAAACSGTASPSGSPGPTGAVGAGATPQVVTVSMTDAGCPPDPATIAAGPVTFQIANASANAATEVELLKDNAILGEKENLTPGLSGSFSLDLEAGTYQVSCPGAATAQSTLTVTAAAAPSATAPSATAPSSGAPASAAGDLSGALAQATAAYAAYVRDQVAQLVTSTKAFAAAVEAGDVAKAKSLYPAPRVFYERIEPVAESFGDLDPRIDGRIDDAPSPDQFTGFHRIEQALFADNTAEGMTPIAQQLVTDVTQLQTLVATATYQPAQLANGASELLDEVAASKITGEEERYSHIDLLDFEANVDGAQEAFELLQPALSQIDPTLASTIEQRFADVDAALQPYRQGNDFVLYTALTQDDTKALAQAVDALAEPLSQVAAKVVGNG